MPLTYNQNTFATTYKDDFRDSDNYHRILFNAGRALQARELTQSQTIIQKEIARLGRHLFKEGASVNPGGITVNNSYEFIKLNTAANALPADPNALVGVTLTSDEGIQVKVIEVVTASGADPATLYVQYLSTSAGTSGTTPIRVAPGEDLNGGGFTLTIQTTNQIGNFAVGTGTRVSNNTGDFFAFDHFVFAPQQSIILSKYSSTPTASVGFKVTRDIVTASDNSALFDNQGAVPNQASPGADRYRIRLTLIDKANVTADENYIEVATINNGVIAESVVANNQYNILADVMARRTKEESGDYIAKPFELLFETNDSDNTKIDFIISPGTAYVDGYRVNRDGVTTLTIPKPRSTLLENNQVVAASYGNYVLTNGNKGLPEFDTLERLDLRDAQAGAGSIIGTARVRAIEEDGSSIRLYLFDVKMTAGSKFSSVRCIADKADPTNNYSNLVLENSKAVLYDAGNTGLLFELPVQRPKTLSDISLAVQRKIDDQTDGAGTGSITLSTTGETFVDTSLWIGSGANVGRDSSASFSGAGTQAANISGAEASQNPYEIAAYVNKSIGSVRTKTLTETTQTITPNGSGDVIFNKADIYQFIRIRETDSDGEDVTGLYTQDNGQRDDQYELGRLLLIPGNTAPASVFVRYKYFAHGAGGDFFAVNSYTGQVDYEDIPNHTLINGETISLRDYLDFRPTAVDSDNTRIGKYTNINELPRNTDVIQFDAEFYQGVGIKVVCSTDGRIDAVSTRPQILPKLPRSPENSLDLFEVILNPYMIDDNDLSVRLVQHKRFTMADINRLEQRLSRLEEVTALSLLELATNTFDVLDSAGTNRTKSGFVVDNFVDNARMHVNSRSSVDPTRQIMRPFFENYNVGLKYDSDASTNTIIKGDNIYTKYTEELWLENAFITGSINVNPFAVITKDGFLELSPQSDEWFDTKFLEPIVIDGGFKQGNVTGKLWADWDFNWSGVNALEIGDTIGGKQGAIKLGNRGRPISTATQSGNWITTTTTTTQSQSRTDTVAKVAGIRTVNTFIDEAGVEINRTNIPFMRSRKIYFRAHGLLPNTRHYPFFGGKDVSSYVKKEAFVRQATLDSDYSSGYNNITQHPSGPTATLTSEADGTLEGSFFLPNTPTLNFAAGERVFKLINVTNAKSEDYTSQAAAKYYAQGVTIHKQQTVLSTRIVDINVSDRFVQMANLTTTTTRLTRDQPNQTDPVAQSFFVDTINGLSLTKVGIHIATKPTDTTPLILQIRPMVNGHPHSTEHVPGSVVYKTPSEISTSTDGSAVTYFEFEEPVYLNGGTEYAIVLLCNTVDYNVYIAEAGAFLLGSTEKILRSQATLGSLFKSQNSFTWEPDQMRDMTFKLYRAKFANGVTTQAVFHNKKLGKKQLTNALITTNASATVRCVSPDHGFMVGDVVNFADVTTVGGISAANINGERTITAVDQFQFEFTAGASATSAKTGGGTFSHEMQVQYDVSKIGIDAIVPDGTLLDYEAKHTTGKSLGSSATAYVKDTSFADTFVNRTVYHKNRKLIPSRRNEIVNNGSVSGFTVRAQMSSVSDYVSPVIDTQRTSIALITNTIDSQELAGGNTPIVDVAATDSRTFLQAGPPAFHLTEIVSLAQPAKGLKILLAANRPSTAGFDVYYRTNAEGNINDASFVLQAVETPMPSDEDPNAYRDYRYLVGGEGGSLDDFTEFQVKIVMSSTNACFVPQFKDLRIIALTV